MPHDSANFGMKNKFGGTSISQEIRIELWLFGNHSYVIAKKEHSFQEETLFSKMDISEEEAKTVFTKTVEAFRLICEGCALQWKPMEDRPGLLHCGIFG